MLDLTPVLNMLIPFHVGAKNIHAYYIKLQIYSSFVSGSTGKMLKR